MAIHDRWHKDEREPDGQRTGKQARTADYGCEKRWQVRWRDHTRRQRKQSFAKKAAAEQFDARIRTQLADGSYIDPSAGEVTFRSFAEDWRQHRMHNLATANRVETNLRNHVYPGDIPGRTPRGGMAIGDYPMKAFAQRPSILQAWIKGLPLADSSKLLVIGYVSQVFKAAIADRIIHANPLKATSIQFPEAPKKPAVPWTAEQITATAVGLPVHMRAIPLLAAATGLRQGEAFAVSADDVVFQRKTLHVEVQVKIVRPDAYFAPLKNHKTCPSRDIPLAEPGLRMLAEHMRDYPPVPVTLPWGKPDGKPVIAS